MRRFGIKSLLIRGRYSILATVCLVVGYYVGHFRTAFTIDTAGNTQFHSALSKSLKQETVMVVGGSAAHGWADPNNNSYLQRAFQSLTDTTNTVYTYDDQTIVGGGAASVDHKTFASWLRVGLPNVVVISWGLLNDIKNNTAASSFDGAIRDEIQQSLQAHAVVLLVTPPVVEASVNNTSFKHYIADEYAVAHAFHSRNVYWFNLNEDMAVYLQAHGQYLSDYVEGTWHPNEAGHALGGELLFNELIETFGSKPISFVRETSHNLIDRLKQGLHISNKSS